MKDRVIEHLVTATTRHPGRVLAAAALLCVLSALATGFLLRSDLTFKGMIGRSAPPVGAYDRVIREFEVSGVITVAVEPQAAVAATVAREQQRVDDAVFALLDQAGRRALFAVVSESAGDDMGDLEGRAVALVSRDVLAAMAPTVRAAALDGVAELTDEDRRYVLENIGAEDARVRRSVLRKVRTLPPATVERLMAAADDLPAATRDGVARAVLAHLSVGDKRSFVGDLAGLAEDRRAAAMATTESAEREIAAALGGFKGRALEFAGDLSNTLRSEQPLDPGADGGELRSDVVKGVLYSDEFSFSRDQQMYLVMVSPVKDIDQLANAKQFARLVDTGLAEAKARFSDLVVRRTGFAAVQMDTQQAMVGDVGVMMGITILGILLISLVGLRSVGYPLLSMIPLGAGVIIMFGFYSLYGELNLVSIMTPVILFGLGIDYAIHFGARYGEVRLERGPDASQADVLREVLDSIGAGLVIAAVTTVFAFLSLMASTIGGFVQSGLLAASGVISAFLAMAYLLPVLVTWRERRARRSRQRFLQTGRYLWLGKLAGSHAGTVASVVLVALAISAWVYLPRIELERDGMKLTPEGVESITLSKALEEKFSFTDAQSYFIIEGYDTLKRFRRELNREEGGEKVYPAINTLRAMDARKAIRTFEKQGWDRQLESLPEYVAKFAAKTNLMGGTNTHIAALYEFIVRNYVDWQNDRFLIIVPPSGYVWDADMTEMYVSDLSRLEEKFGVQSAGFVQIWKFLVDHLMGDLLASSLVAFLLVIVILWSTTRSFRGTLVCTTALLVALLATLSVIGMLGIKFNCVNVIAFPIIIGLGIDYLVHVYYRLVHEERGDVVRAVSSTGKAVFLTTLTTLVAFGAISFSVHNGLSLMGVFSLIGLVMAFLSSVFLVPTLVKLFMGGARLRP